MHKLLAQLLQLGGVGKLPVPEQIGGFFKAGVVDQISDLITAVDQSPGGAVDETDVAGYRDNSLKTTGFCRLGRSLSHVICLLLGTLPDDLLVLREETRTGPKPFEKMQANRSAESAKTGAV